MANAERCAWCDAVLTIGPRDTRKKFCGALCRDTYWNAARAKNSTCGQRRRRRYGEVMAGFTMAPEVAAYIAGFFDGEGHIGIYKQARKESGSGWRFKGVIEVSNTNTAVLAHIERLLGGNCYRTGKEMNNGHNPRAKPLYRLRLTANQGRVILPMLLPYLVVKKEIAELALEFWKTVDRLPVLASRHHEALDVFWQRAKALNKRGI